MTTSNEFRLATQRKSETNRIDLHLDTQTTKRPRTICQPKGTIPYTVGESDTLEKVSLMFNSTPSELMHLNKLNSRIVFPGQVCHDVFDCRF